VPELIEVELYRAALDPLLGEPVTAILIHDPAFARPKGTPVEVFDQIVGQPLTRTSRLGKLLCLHIGSADAALVVGLRFGMTGRLLIDGTGPIEKLQYASARDEARWDRVVLTIGRRNVSVRDQRRLGSIELDPDLDRLGVEASTISAVELEQVIGGRTKAIKAVLLDQQLIAGLGNLLVDELLWVAGVSPGRTADTFSGADVTDLAGHIRATVTELTGRGGSHTGTTFEARIPGGTCPLDGAAMQHDTVGGRSTWWCPTHQH